MKIAKRIELDNGLVIETWYDRHTRSWTSQLKDSDGNQIGDAQHDGQRTGVPMSQKVLRLVAAHAKFNSPDFYLVRYWSDSAQNEIRANIKRILAKWHRAKARVQRRIAVLQAFDIPARIVDHRLDELVRRIVAKRYKRRARLAQLRAARSQVKGIRTKFLKDVSK